MSQTIAIKTLHHGQQVKMQKNMFKYEPVVTVGTVEGYAREYRENEADAVARCLENQKARPYDGHKLAWTNKHAMCLTADYVGKTEHMIAARMAFADCVELIDGETVEIEGRNYTVKYLGDYSDPIHFIPASPAQV